MQELQDETNDIDVASENSKYVEEEVSKLVFISKQLFSIVVNSSSHTSTYTKSPTINMNTNNEVSVNVKSSTNQMIKETNSSDKEIESELILDKSDCTQVVNE
ncbi:27876_t:CDS:2 [Dentiscutata erythropus]|uniref:27876_t:CDS:1 n=1 Tax=Dentiscutata erythropus TaxID=1348616 RepID=A0A9N9CQJ9_9GLOM|nr:27876_t:CDS:2 [Dentiscutata erythropus]